MNLRDGEAEKAVLGALLLGCEPGALADLRRLIPSGESFAKASYQRTYTAMLGLLDRGQALDIITVRDQLQRDGTLESVGGTEAVAKLADAVPTTANLLYHANIVRDYAQRRALANAGQSAIQLASTRDIPIEQGVAQTLQSLIAAQRHDFEQRVTKVGTGLLDAAEKLLARNQGLVGVGTGIHGLDELLGGLQRQCVTLIAANASVGKTSLALAIGRHIAEERPVYHVSLEMPKDQLIGRLLCAEAGVYQGARYYSDYDVQKLMSAGKAIGPLPMYLDTSPLTPQHIRMEVQALQAQGLDPVVVIDYLQLLRWPVKQDRENKNVEVGHISRFIKRDIAMALNVPVLCLSQLSRKNIEGGKKRPPVESDLRDSGSLEQDADHILMLHYDGAEDGRSSMPGWPDAQLTEGYLRKNRGGSKGVVKLKYDRPTGRWGDYGP